MTSEFFKEIKKIIEEKTGIETSEIHPDSYIEDDLNIGEMELIEILTELEDKFHVDLMENKDDIETVADLMDLMAEQVE